MSESKHTLRPISDYTMTYNPVLNTGAINVPGATTIPDTGVFNGPILANSALWTVKNNVTVNVAKPHTYKYSESLILTELLNYIEKTYDEHYKSDSIQCFDTWVARGTASSTAIDTAQKYLWRYGQKEGKNKKDLLKALHYIVLAMHVDHYKE